jgi:integrase
MPVYEKKGRKGPKGERVWRVVVWAKGKSHEKLVPGTKKEATTFEATWRLELESVVEAEPSPKRREVDLLTFSRTDYAVHAKAHLRPKTWKVRRYQLATLCDAHTYVDGDGRTVVVNLGALKLTALTTDQIDKYKAARTAEGWKPGTINTELGKLQAVIAYAKDLGIPCASPKFRLLPTVGAGRVKFWTEEQLAQLYAAVTEECPDLLPVVVFLVNTGCREGEAIACERAWIDLKRRLICITPNEYWQPKNGKPREIPISDALFPYLERALATTTGKYVFVTSRRHAGQEEKSRWACWPKKQFNRARIAAKLVGGPHTLRHTYASHFLQGCPDMFLLSQILGHSHEGVTRIYAHLLPTHMERARNVVNVSPAKSPAPSDTMATTMAAEDAPGTSTSGNAPCALETIAERCNGGDAGTLHFACDARLPYDRDVDALSRLFASQQQDAISEAAGTMASNHGQDSAPLGPTCDPSGFYSVGAIGFEPTTPTVSR